MTHAYLFDTDAIVEVLRSSAPEAYLHWLRSVPEEAQFVSTVTLAELFRGAYRVRRPDVHVRALNERVVPSLRPVPFGSEEARAYGRITAELDAGGRTIAHADAQIAATAVTHDLVLVTGNLKHMERVPGLRIERVLARARREGP